MRKPLVSLFIVALLSACGGSGTAVVPPSNLARVGQTLSEIKGASHAVRSTPYFKSFASIPDPTEISDNDVNQNIDQDIKGADREAVRTLMLRLRKTERNNVVLIANGRAIANHRALLQGATIAQPQDSLVRVSNGEQIAFPPFFKAPTESSRRVRGGPIPPNSDTMGPFHRSYDANDGYSQIVASPSLPCNASPFMSTGQPYGPYRDNGYIYFANRTYSDSYEGGMFYEASQATNDYILYQTDQNDGGGFFTMARQYAMACGQNSNLSSLTMTMSWSIVGDNLLALHFRGYNTAHQIEDLTITRAPAGLGWYNNCSSCTVSTTTSIAQASGGPGGYWPDGWYFGTDPNAFNPSIGWFGMLEGHCNQNTPSSTDCYDQTGAGKEPFRQSFPTDQNQVLVSPGDNLTYWSERVGISLRLDANAAPLSPSYDGRGDAFPADTPTPMPKCGRIPCPQ